MRKAGLMNTMKGSVRTNSLGGQNSLRETLKMAKLKKFDVVRTHWGIQPTLPQLPFLLLEISVTGIDHKEAKYKHSRPALSPFQASIGAWTALILTFEFPDSTLTTQSKRPALLTQLALGWTICGRLL